MTPRVDLLPLYERWETELIGRASAAVVTSRPIADAIRSQRRDLPMATVRNGVDSDSFRSRAHYLPRPEDLPFPCSAPVVGFVGALYDWIDWSLIGRVAMKLAGFSFVFVGPFGSVAPPAWIVKLPNVRFLGHRPYNLIPAYISAFDVCWLPFKEDCVTVKANPVKIYEYLALGKPVVSTPVADQQSFEGLIAVGRTPDSVARLLCTAASDSGARSLERMGFAQRNTWKARAIEYLDYLAAIGPHSSTLPAREEPASSPLPARLASVRSRSLEVE